MNQITTGHVKLTNTIFQNPALKQEDAMKPPMTDVIDHTHDVGSGPRHPVKYVLMAPAKVTAHVVPISHLRNFKTFIPSNTLQ